MILEIAADTAQRNGWSDADCSQVIRIADAGQHQKLRRIDSAPAQNDLALRNCGAALSIRHVFDTGSALPLDQHADRKRTRRDGQVASSQHRMEVGACRSVAQACSNGPLRPAEPMLLRAIVIVGVGMPGGDAGVDVSLVKRIEVFRPAHVKRPAAAAIFVLAVLPGFRAFQVGKNFAERPPGQTAPRPAVVIGRISADISHCIDRVRATDDLAACNLDIAITGGSTGVGPIIPVETPEAPDAPDTQWYPDQRMPIPTAGFQQQHTNGGIGTKSVGNDAARGARSHDHIVVAPRFLHPASMSCQTVTQQAC